MRKIVKSYWIFSKFYTGISIVLNLLSVSIIFLRFL